MRYRTTVLSTSPKAIELTKPLSEQLIPEGRIKTNKFTFNLFLSPFPVINFYDLLDPWRFRRGAFIFKLV